jgi:predicted amidohydrolase YtcJ
MSSGVEVMNRIRNGISLGSIIHLDAVSWYFPMRRFTLVTLLALSSAALGRGQQSADAPKADLVLRNGKIVTLLPEHPVVQAIAILGDRIISSGSDADAPSWTGPKTRVIDLHGMLAIPGFIEGHGHFTGIGEFRLGLDLREARTWDAIVAQVARAVKTAKPGEWIVGRGWHQSKWDRAPEPSVEGFPVHASLSAVSPNNPVLLSHASGHAAFVNQKALEAAGIGRATPDPAGGEILKDNAGNPTGLLRESAEGLANRAYSQWRDKRAPEERAAEFRRISGLASDECLSKGITSFVDAGSPLETVDGFRELARKNELRLRLWVMLSGSEQELGPNLDRYRIIGEGGNRLTVRAIKQFMDGALGSRGAWLLAPYADKPESRGLNTEDPAEIRRMAELAIVGSKAEEMLLLADRELGERNPAKAGSLCSA